MLTFKKNAAQGEIYMTRITKAQMPTTGLKPMKVEGGYFIIGHSETGHHHVLEATKADVFVADKAPEGMQILYAILKEPTALKHLRDHDTHEPISFAAGDVVQFRTAREYDPFAELARRSID